MAEPQETQQDARESAGTWGYQAWRMWCSGNRNKAAIFRALKARYGEVMPSHEDCVARAIARESKIARAALNIDETDSLMEYIAGLEELFGEADRLMRTGDNDNAKLGGLKLKVDLLEKLAAAEGVVTQRKAQEHSGAVAVAVTTIDVAAVVDDAEKSRAACDLLALLRSGTHDAGGAGDGDGTVPVPPGQAPEPAEQQAAGPDGGADQAADGDDAAAPREE